jgi:hypothetical protein
MLTPYSVGPELLEEYAASAPDVWSRGWIDNTKPQWSDTPHYPKLWPFIPPILALKLAVKYRK